MKTFWFWISQIIMKYCFFFKCDSISWSFYLFTIVQVLYLFILYFSGKKAQKLPRHAPKSNPSMCLNISRWLKLVLKLAIGISNKKLLERFPLKRKMCLPIIIQLHWYVLPSIAQNSPIFEDIVNLKLLSIPISEDLTNVGVSNC